MQLIYGRIEKEVQDIDVLKDLNQEMANSIATGPQTEFYEELDSFNGILSHYGVESLDITNTWRWKAGVYDKIDKLIAGRLALHKKSNGIGHKIERARDNMRYINHIRSMAWKLENLKHTLKKGGYSRDVDINEFKEKTSELASTINKQCDIAYDRSDGKIEIKPYLSNEINARDTKLMYELIIRDMNILVYDGKKDSKLIQKVEAEKDSYIRMIIQKNLRESLNNTRIHYQIIGTYKSNYKWLRNPYISSFNNTEYGTVCLSSYEDDVQNSLKNTDFMSLQYHLLSWAQYYHNQYSNPYNNISLFHIGLPESYSSEYKATISNVSNSCGKSMKDAYKPDFNLKNSIALTNNCDDRECAWRLGCGEYVNTLYFQNKLHDCEYVTQVESFIGSLREYLEPQNLSKYELLNKLASIFD